MSHYTHPRGWHLHRALARVALVILLAGTGISAGAAAAAVPAAPANLTATRVDNTSITLAWDRVPGAVGYDVMVGSENIRTVNNVYVPIRTLASSVQTWQVRAISSTNEASTWAQSGLGSSAVGGPQLLSPTAGATLQQPNDPPLLSWQPVTGAIAYTVSLDADDDFVGATEIRTRSTSLVVPSALTAGDWYWKVSADLGNGISSASSTERRFDVLPLADPTMSSPQNNVDVQDVVLNWAPVVGAKSYDVVLLLTLGPCAQRFHFSCSASNVCSF